MSGLLDVAGAVTTPEGRPDISTPPALRANAELLHRAIRAGYDGPRASKFGTGGYTIAASAVLRTARLQWDGLDGGDRDKPVMDAILGHLAETGNLVRDGDHWWVSYGYSPDGAGREFPPEPVPNGQVRVPPVPVVRPAPEPPAQPAPDPVEILRGILRENDELRARVYLLESAATADQADTASENAELRSEKMRLLETIRQLRGQIAGYEGIFSTYARQQLPEGSDD